MRGAAFEAERVPTLSCHRILAATGANGGGKPKIFGAGCRELGGGQHGAAWRRAWGLDLLCIFLSKHNVLNVGAEYGPDTNQ
jgi:hypothetical protein